MFSFALIFSMIASVLHAAEYYVVIGAFEKESNAREFTSEVRNFFVDVSYSFSDTRKFYYVHVLKTTRKEEARNWTLYLKSEKGFKDAWVFSEANDDRSDTNIVAALSAHRAPRYSPDQIVALDHGLGRLSSASNVELSTYNEKSVRDASISEMAWTNQWGIGYIADLKNDEASELNQLAEGQLFKFIVEDSKGQTLPAEVMLVDFERIKKITSFDNGGYAAIRGTKPNQMVTFVCEVLGFKPETRMYNIDHLSRGRDVHKNEDGIWEVRFKLKNMDVNEFSFMNKTSFYEDAAILQPSSKEEMDKLVALMKSNPEYKIIIHSHSNPGGSREIKFPEGEDAFDLSSSFSKRASVKKLTKARAATLRNYLVAHGISKKRIGIIGWGGFELLAESTGPDSDINERVEIELTDDGK